MNKHTKYNLLAVFLAFVGMITLGGLGNAAVKSASFYWLPFVLNLGVYGWGVYTEFTAGAYTNFLRRETRNNLVRPYCGLSPFSLSLSYHGERVEETITAQSDSEPHV